MIIVLQKHANPCQPVQSNLFVSILTTSFEFLWIDKQRYRRPTRLPARIYIDYLLNWLVTQFDDETLFPVAEGIIRMFM